MDLVLIVFHSICTDHERKVLLWRKPITLTWLPCIKATWIELELLLSFERYLSHKSVIKASGCPYISKGLRSCKDDHYL